MSLEKIHDLFNTIDDSIAASDSFEKINSLFNEALPVLSILEVEDEFTYYEAKNQYHTKKSCYLRSFGKLEESSTEEKLAFLYKSKLAQSHRQESANKNNCSSSSSSFVNVFPHSEEEEQEGDLTLPSLSKTKLHVQKCFNDLKDQKIISNQIMQSVINELENLLERYLILNEIHSFEQYDNLEKLSSQIHHTLSSFQDQIILDNKETDNPKEVSSTIPAANEMNFESDMNDPVTQLLFLITTFDTSVYNCLNVYRRNFFQFLLIQKQNLREILFSNIPLTQERINSHARKLSKIFHPDKALNENDKNDFREIFQCIINCKDNLLNELTQNGTICDRELIQKNTTEGQNLWQIARDYSRARNGKWEELIHLKGDEMKNRTDSELSKLQKTYSIFAYEQYRAAALALGIGGTGEERSELRRMMAITLYTGEEYLQAQMYTIAAMYILMNDAGNNINNSKITELQKLLERIQNPNRQNTSSSTVTAKSSSTSLPSTQLVSTAHQQSSAVILKAQIKNELRTVVLQQCLIRGEEKQIETSKELILAAKTKAAQYETLTLTMSGTTGIAGFATMAQAYQTISTGILLGSTVGPAGIALGITGGLIIVAGGSLLTKKSFDIARNLSEEPAIRDILNERLSKAIDCCKRQMYSEFLDLLAKPYWDNLCLLKIETHGDSIEINIDSQHIIDELLKHEFRPDGIAYLLILIGEALLHKPKLVEKKSNNNNNKTSNLRQPMQSTFNELASKLFRDVFTKNLRLQQKAKELDAQVQKKHLDNFSLNKIQYLWRSMVSSKYTSYIYSIPEEYFKDALSTPFTTRLDELCDIARLNYSITQIIIGGVDNLNESQDTILEIKRKQAVTENNQFFKVSQLTMQAIDDLLMAFGLTPKPLIDDNLLALENKFLFENINTVMIGNVAVNCEYVKAVSNASQQLEAFCELCNMKVILTQREFTEKVKELYTSGVNESLKINIQHMMNGDNINNNDINDWFNQHFCQQKWILSNTHLPILSHIFNIQIRICATEINSIYGRVFVENSNNTMPSFDSSIFIVLDDNKKIICMFKTCELKLNYLLDQLRLVESNESKIRLYHQITLHYRLKAEYYEQIHRLKALPEWNTAKDNYLHIIQLNSNDLIALLGYARCLIMLGKWKKANEFLCNTLKSHEDSNEAWYLLGLTNRKLRLYDKANYAVQKALAKSPDYKDASNELRIIDALKSEKVEDRLNVYNRITVNDINNNRQNENSLNYNILSIDGGGIRGLMPAVWLSEIERRTNRSASSMFHMMAGTSTGAIIAAGLSVPNRDAVHTPRYRAADLVKLYVAHSNEVFKKPTARFYNIRRYMSKEAKYVANGRQKLFGQYFDHTLLSQVLTELVIPAVKNDTQLTHLFNRYDCRHHHAQDYQLQDILMCTTAAPTYFEPYKMDNCQYVDGGVQMNNPVMAAYDEAIRYGKSKDNLFILSLGTGDYVPNPLHPNDSRHLLFYAMHSQEILNIIFDGPQYNTDVHMLSVLNKEKYQRWQVWFEEPVELDSNNESSIEILFDSARAHFEEMEEYDNDKRLGLLLDRLKDDAH